MRTPEKTCCHAGRIVPAPWIGRLLLGLALQLVVFEFFACFAQALA
jgi:hypothetical protein